MGNVVIDDKHLHDIGDALRSKLGNTRIEQVVEIIHHPETIGNMAPHIAKTPNATGFSTRNGGYGNSINGETQTITIPGATSLLIDIAYQTESTTYDYLYISIDSVKYGGSTLTRKTLTADGNIVKFTFHSDSSSSDYLGFYAEVYGLDADGNIMQETIPAWDEEVIHEVEVSTTYKPRDMAAAIGGLTVPSSDNEFANVGMPIMIAKSSGYNLTGYLLPLATANTAYLFLELRALGDFYNRTYNGIDSSRCVARSVDSIAGVVAIPSEAITATSAHSVSIRTQSSNVTSQYSTLGVVPVQNIDASSIVLTNFNAAISNKTATIKFNNNYADYKKIVIIMNGFVYNDTNAVNSVAFYPVEENSGFERIPGTITAAAGSSSYYTGAGAAVLVQNELTHPETLTITTPDNSTKTTIYGCVVYYKTPEEA